jgi:hypothetical protein
LGINSYYRDNAIKGKGELGVGCWMWGRAGRRVKGRRGSVRAEKSSGKVEKSVDILASKEVR